MPAFHKKLKFPPNHSGYDREPSHRRSSKPTHYFVKMGLDPVLVKNLLQDIEASGKTRKEFSLIQLVEEKRHTYGEPGSEKRRLFQKKFDLLLRKTPKKYGDFLDRNHVNHGEGLKRELRAGLDSSSTVSGDSVTEEEGSVTNKSSPSSSSTSTTASSIVKAESKRSVRPSKPPSITRHTTQFETQEPTTPPREVAFGTNHLASPTTTTLLVSPTTMYSAASSSVLTTESSVVAAVLQQIESLSSFRMDGSVDFPYIIMVDASKPEANWGFEVAYVQQVEHMNFNRDIYHIRKVTGVPQDNEWEASIPSKKYPTLADRDVLIRGPSQDYWHKDASVYHQMEFCERTKKVHESLQTALDTNKDRLYSHWLLVFPQGTHLENHVFSGDAVHVKKESLDLCDSFSYVDENNKTKDVELFGMDVYWRIAVKGGEMIRSPNAPKKKRFPNRKK
jgi:hypothetical protein